MAVLSDYTSGTITLANGSTAVTGTGTLFDVAKFREGDTLQIENLTAVIASVDSNTQLTLTAPWSGTSLADAPYRARYLPDGSRVTAQATTLIELLGNGVLSNLAELGVEEGKVPVGNAAGEYELQDYLDDRNGSLGKLAALTLADNKFLNTDGTGDLTQSDITTAALVLLNLAGTAAANKLPYFDAANSAALAEYTAAARALTNLSGTAAADMLPYLTGPDGAGLTVLTAFARSILDDANGAAIFDTMGATQSLGPVLSAGYQKLPSGLIIQWGSSVVTTAGEVALVNYPTTYPTAVFATVVCNGDTNTSAALTAFGVHIGTSNTNFVLRTGGFSGTVRANWLSVGR